MKLLEDILAIIPELRNEAVERDRDGGFPFASFAKLRDIGLLKAPLPAELGGLGWNAPGGLTPLFRLLTLLGYTDLSLGRIFEAHVNALELVRSYGTKKQLEVAAAAMRAGQLFALWVSDDPDDKLRLSGDLVLTGKKSFCSAAGAASWSVVTAEARDDAEVLLLLELTPAPAIDRGPKLSGMRAAATAKVTFGRRQLSPGDILGQPGDYLREPLFSTGAWRTSAVILGGLAALIEVNRTQLLTRGRDAQPFQQMRFGQMKIAYETGLLWLSATVDRLKTPSGEGADAIAYVNLTRTVVETTCLDCIRLVQRSLGLAAFAHGSPAERIARDLMTYLRQPAPDEILTEAAAYYMHRPVGTP